jgi:hypothetical protein
VSLVAQDEAPLLRDIERVLRLAIPVVALPEFEIPAEPAPSARAAHGAGHARHNGPRQQPGAHHGYSAQRNPGSQQRRGGGRHRAGQAGRRSPAG